MPEITKAMARVATADSAWWGRDHCAAILFGTSKQVDFPLVFPSLLPDHIADLWRGAKKRATSSRILSKSRSGRRADGVEVSMTSGFHRTALEHLDGLFGYAMTLTRNSAEAEDLVQETYLRATRAKNTLAPNSHVKSWLFTILRNVFLNQARHRRAGPPLVNMEDEGGAPLPLADEEAVDPLTSFLTEERQRRVRNAIDLLPDSFREVILLREFEDLSYQEIATVLDCPVGTVMSRLGRARDKLRQTLQHRSKEKTA